ncbi:Transitional endoplasmic reticulum ATPase [Perkinsela sp. CCAP 1560/4]|nr:Transitional endoplasmic reticulum ATPase [Perkinsela sp. CCAP 1560/4]|eukprot:KNH09599.1 Transitional endoplasmic reticulum ATPase [Perkinsela sp. CCAP 1560/4]
MNEQTQYGTVHILSKFARQHGFSEGDFMFVQESRGYLIREERCGLVYDKPIRARFPCRVTIKSSLEVSRDAQRYAKQHDSSVVGRLKGDVFLPDHSDHLGTRKTDFSSDFLLMEDIHLKDSAPCYFSKKPTLEASVIELKLSKPVNFLKLAIEVEANLGDYMTQFFHGLPHRQYLTTESHLQMPTRVREKLTRNDVPQPSLPDLVVHGIICSNGRRKKAGGKTEVAVFRLSKDAQCKILLKETLPSESVLEDNTVQRYNATLKSAVNVLMMYHLQKDSRKISPPCILMRSASTEGGTFLSEEIIKRAGMHSMTVSFTEFVGFLRANLMCETVLQMFDALIVRIDHQFTSSSDFDQTSYEDLRAFLSLFDDVNFKRRSRFNKAILLVAQNTHPRIDKISTIVIDCDSIRPQRHIREEALGWKRSTAKSTQPEGSGVFLHGLEETIQTLQIAFQLQHSESKLPVRFPHGVLLHGPPGCGKTSIIKYFAQIQCIPVMHLDCSTIFSSYVGESERNLRSIFAEARAISPCILFLDDVEAIGGKRSSETSGVDIRLLSTLLAEMDGVTPSGGVVFVGATNAPNLIDSALMRPGRFDFVIEVPRPNLSSRKSMIEGIFKRANTCPTAGFVDALVAATNGCSGAAVENFVHSGIRNMVTRKSKAELESAALELVLQDFNEDDLR